MLHSIECFVSNATRLEKCGVSGRKTEIGWLLVTFCLFFSYRLKMQNWERRQWDKREALPKLMIFWWGTHPYDPYILSSVATDGGDWNGRKLERIGQLLKLCFGKNRQKFIMVIPSCSNSLEIFLLVLPPFAGLFCVRYGTESWF